MLKWYCAYRDAFVFKYYFCNSSVNWMERNNKREIWAEELHHSLEQVLKTAMGINM